MEKSINGTAVQFDSMGYMTDLNQWDVDLARVLAEEEGIELTAAHMEVLTYLQSQFRSEVPLSIRKIGKSGVVSIKQFYQLFPDGPLKKASRIAGIPKPVSCI
jgi:tRNA 2-thiouridine synthesizing protein E